MRAAAASRAAESHVESRITHNWVACQLTTSAGALIAIRDGHLRRFFEQKVAMRPIIEELNLLEHRLRAAASQVVQTIDVFAPRKRATTYGRSGRVR